MQSNIVDEYYPILPNTSLAATYVDKAAVYAYAQAAQDAGDAPGALLEIQGEIAPGDDPARDLETYVHQGLPKPIALTKKGEAPPKLFTPLASAWMIDWESKRLRRYVFYVDNDDFLCDIFEDNGCWYEGGLCKFMRELDGGTKCACYSKLAATRLRNAAGADFICVFYQNCNDSGYIQSVCLSHMGYNCGPAPLCDPPLVGTALAAVPPEAGIKSESGTDEQAVVFFQYNTLILASSQDDQTPVYTTYNVTPKEKSLSGHAYLAAVDDGKDAWCFYTSDDNYIRKVSVDSNASLAGPERVGLDQTAVPASPLAATLAYDTTRELIVLFYLIRDTEENRRRRHRPGHETGGLIEGPMNIYASTLTRVCTKDENKDDWSVGPGVCLTALTAFHTPPSFRRRAH